MGALSLTERDIHLTVALKLELRTRLGPKFHNPLILVSKVALIRRPLYNISRGYDVAG